MRLFWLSISMILLLTSSVGAIEIERVEVEGNLRVSVQKILSIFGLQPGDEYMPGKVSQGVKRLFRTKTFRDIVVSYRLEGNRAVILLKVEEYPRVKDIFIRGNKHAKSEEIEEKLMLREGYFARPSLMTKDVAAIKEFYGEKGYNRASIEVRKTLLEKDHMVVVTYQIVEGEKIKIKHIDFIGNGAIESKFLIKLMESKEDRWWRGGELKPNVLEEDLKTIKQLYENEGYLDANVAIDRQVEVDGGKHVDLYIRIDEGRRYYIGDVTWTGNTVFPDDEIEGLVVIEEGNPYAVETVEIAQVAGINSLYWEKGYIWNRILSERTIKRQRIDLNYRIIENNPASVREIKISGNTKTFETVIRREFQICPGDTFILGDVQRSLRDIFLLGYFTGPPAIDTERINEQGDINLLVEVQEKETGHFKFGTGFSQLNSLSGFLGVTENNFLGRGKSVSLDWEFGKWRKNLNLRYSEPHFFGTETALSISVFNWIQDRVRQQYYTDRRQGFSVQLGHPFPWLDYTRIFLGYRFERVKLSNFASVYPTTGTLWNIDWPLDKSSITFSLTRNSTDSPFHPTTGSISTISAEFTGGPIGGNVQFMRLRSSVAWFRKLFWKFTFHFDMNACVVDVFGDADEVHDFEKFRLGGNRRYALRGYDFYEVVPEGNDPFVGGRFMTTIVQEIIFPFSSQVKSLVFFDAGNTWNSFGEADLFRLKRGLGVGVRLEMPGMGNLGLDYGYGFDKEGGGAWEPHFTFGSFF